MGWLDNASPREKKKGKKSCLPLHQGISPSHPKASHYKSKIYQISHFY